MTDINLQTNFGVIQKCFFFKTVLQNSKPSCFKEACDLFGNICTFRNHKYLYFLIFIPFAFLMLPSKVNISSNPLTVSSLEVLSHENTHKDIFQFKITKAHSTSKKMHNRISVNRIYLICSLDVE